jgi:hypothetical protein
MSNENQTATEEIPSILRTPKHGCFQFYKGGWGTYLRPIDDPEANVVITKDDLNKFDLKENVHKIPADLWQRWVQLCFHYVEKVASNLEVSVRILRSEEDPSKYKIVVPEQKVTAASVRADNFDIAVDIETGEPIESYPPAGWIPVGSSHSHNTMNSFFSGTDDKYELSDPGIHLVIGSVNKQTRKYTIAASVVAGGRRFIVNYNDLIDATPVDDVTFHENVLNFVEYEAPTYHKNTPKTYSYQNSAWQQKTTYKKSKSNKFNDPFHYDEGKDFDSFEAFWEYQESQKQKIKLHQVEDILEDYIKQNQGDPEVLMNLMSSLLVTVDDLESLLTSTEPLTV